MTNFRIQDYKFVSNFWYKYQGKGTILFQQNLCFKKRKNYVVLFYAIIVVPDDNENVRMEIVAEIWIKNSTYHLKFSGRDILLSVIGCLNDSLMDAAQKLTWKSLGSLESWQSVLHWQKSGVPLFEMGESHIQLLHDKVNNWFLVFSSST